MENRQEISLYEPESKKATGVNKFLLSLSDPFSGVQTGVPDFATVAAILKSTVISSTLTSSGSNSGLMVIPFSSPRRNIRVYGFDTVAQRYNLLATFEQSEDLSQNFRLIRLVSGGIAVQSATLTGSNFQVQGTMQGIVCEALPDIRNLTFNTILAYKKDNASFVASVPVSVGISAISPPLRPPMSFLAPETSSVHNSCRTTKLTTGWTQGPIPVGAALVQSIAMPPNTWGHFKVTLNSRFSTPPGATNQQITLRYITAQAIPIGPNYVENFVTNVVLTNTFDANQSWSVTQDLYSELEVLQVEVSIINISGQVMSNQFFNLTTILGSDNSNVQEPAAIIAWDNLNSTQQLAFNAVFNYEAVPNSQLARNVPTTYERNHHPNDMLVAEAAFAHSGEIGLRCIQKLDDFYAQRANGFFLKLANRDFVMAYSASFSDIMSQLGRAIKPIARAVLPTMIRSGGTALAQYTKTPPIYDMSTSLANYVNKALSADLETAWSASLELNDQGDPVLHFEIEPSELEGSQPESKQEEEADNSKTHLHFESSKSFAHDYAYETGLSIMKTVSLAIDTKTPSLVVGSVLRNMTQLRSCTAALIDHDKNFLSKMFHAIDVALEGLPDVPPGLIHQLDLIYPLAKSASAEDFAAMMAEMRAMREEMKLMKQENEALRTKSSEVIPQATKVFTAPVITPQYKDYDTFASMKNCARANGSLNISLWKSQYKDSKLGQISQMDFPMVRRDGTAFINCMFLTEQPPTGYEAQESGLKNKTIPTYNIIGIVAGTEQSSNDNSKAGLNIHIDALFGKVDSNRIQALLGKTAITTMYKSGNLYITMRKPISNEGTSYEMAMTALCDLVPFNCVVTGSKSGTTHLLPKISACVEQAKILIICYPDPNEDLDTPLEAQGFRAATSGNLFYNPKALRLAAFVTSEPKDTEFALPNMFLFDKGYLTPASGLVHTSAAPALEDPSIPESSKAKIRENLAAQATVQSPSKIRAILEQEGYLLGETVTFVGNNGRDLDMAVTEFPMTPADFKRDWLDKLIAMKISITDKNIIEMYRSANLRALVNHIKRVLESSTKVSTKQEGGSYHPTKGRASKKISLVLQTPTTSGANLKTFSTRPETD